MGLRESYSQRERRGFVLERPRRDTNGKSETEVKVENFDFVIFAGTSERDVGLY